MALQMTCPYCHREFPYNNGELDRKISVKGQRILEINKRLAQIKGLSKSQHTRETWLERKKLIEELNRLALEVTELKAVRKACDQQIKAFEFQEFKNQVKERFGEAEYKKIIDAVQEELKAYNASSLMAHEYTRSSSKSNVISINKL